MGVWTLHAFDIPLENLDTSSIMNNDVVGSIFVMMMAHSVGFAVLHKILQTNCIIYRDHLTLADQEDVLVNSLKAIYLGGICVPCLYLLLSICFETQSSSDMTEKATGVCNLVLPIVVLLLMELVVKFRHILDDNGGYLLLGYNLIFSGVTVLIAYTLSITNLLSGATVIFFLTFGAFNHFGLVLHKLSSSSSSYDGLKHRRRTASLVLRIGCFIWLISRFVQGAIVVLLLLHSGAHPTNISIGITIGVSMSILQLIRIKNLLQLAREGDKEDDHDHDENHHHHHHHHNHPSGGERLVVEDDNDNCGSHNKKQMIIIPTNDIESGDDSHHRDDDNVDGQCCSCQCHHLLEKEGRKEAEAL